MPRSVTIDLVSPLAFLLLALAGLSRTTDAHEGDPKAQDRRPRTEAARFGTAGSLALSTAATPSTRARPRRS